MNREQVEKSKSLLGEDTEAVLRSASIYGIRYLVFVASSSSMKAPRGSDSFYSVKDFGEIIP